MCWNCFGSPYLSSEYKVLRPAYVASESAWSIGRAMQIGSQKIDVELTEDGFRINLDSLKS